MVCVGSGLGVGFGFLLMVWVVVVVLVSILSRCWGDWVGACSCWGVVVEGWFG